jgi:hypothetical protein
MDRQKLQRELRLLAVLSAVACGASLAMDVELLPAAFVAFTLISVAEAVRLR